PEGMAGRFMFRLAPIRDAEREPLSIRTPFPGTTQSGQRRGRREGNASLKGPETLFPGPGRVNLHQTAMR
ncbi:hypothetical protein ADK59_37125, partial [Streptomyces sp. XY332]